MWSNRHGYGCGDVEGFFVFFFEKMHQDIDQHFGLQIEMGTDQLYTETWQSKFEEHEMDSVFEFQRCQHGVRETSSVNHTTVGAKSLHA